MRAHHGLAAAALVSAARGVERLGQLLARSWGRPGPA
jgi:hypothetical protein